MLLLNANSIQMAIAILVAVLLGMTVHEFAHNYIGFVMGDPTPAREGRLTLDPRKHINWVGFLMFVLIGFGVLGTAPIAAYRMRNPRWGYLAAVAAGPLSNLLLAVLFAIPLRLLNLPPRELSAAINGVTSSPAESLALLFGQIVFWNVLLFIFNLLPFFPIDGWHIVLALLPPDLAQTWQRHARTTQYLLFGLILLSFARIPGLNILNILIRQPVNSIAAFLLGF